MKKIYLRLASRGYYLSTFEMWDRFSPKIPYYLGADGQFHRRCGDHYMATSLEAHQRAAEFGYTVTKDY